MRSHAERGNEITYNNLCALCVSVVKIKSLIHHPHIVRAEYPLQTRQQLIRR